MEDLHLLSLLLSVFLLQFLSFSSSYTLPDKYFINCGSDSIVTASGRSFIGDLGSGSISVGKSEAVGDSNPSARTPELYKTARTYRHTSSYDLPVTKDATYIVRLHFFALTHKHTNLADAVFDVSALNLSMLSNFSVRNISNSPVIKEFLLTPKWGKLSIFFIPAQGTSLAFVNAIEAFVAPAKFIMNYAPQVTSAGSNGNYSNLLAQGFYIIHRINIGGDAIDEAATALLGWIPDDDYLAVPGSAKICPSYSDRLKYGRPEQLEENVVPDLVYKTCREVDAENAHASSNITWRFNVSKKTRHLVRVHFCDIISDSANVVNFSLHIYSKFRQNINPYANADITHMGVPFYHDFVVDSDDSGFISLGIGLPDDGHTTLQRIAYLNGLEIMEFMKESDSIVLSSEPKKKKTLFIIVGSVGGVVVVVLVVVVLLGLKCRKAKPVDFTALDYMVPYGGGAAGSPYSRMSERTITASPVPNLNLKLKIPFAEILDATHNFDTQLLIGEGGFGKVYKGTLRSGMHVAVKRSESKHGQGLPEFHTEIIVLSKIRHRHLVSLIGYCDEGSEMILVYEFMEKGTLRDHLYTLNGDRKRAFTHPELTWKQRLEICIGSAKGLHYLHTGSDGGIIHRDVKSTNILLDEHFIAKVADFGLSRSALPDPDDYSMGVKGSFGYLDPEYFTSFQFTEKSDVYSFGVVLLEVLCARPAIINSPQREEVNLADWGLFWHKKGRLEKIIDPFLVSHINPNSLRKFGEIAEKCLKEHGVDRPSMIDVVWDLEYALQLQQNAVHREPHEDSTTNASLELALRVAQRLPSIPHEKDYSGLQDCSDVSASGVFSQMRIDGAR